MAEVRQCFGRGMRGFAHKIYERYLPESQNIHRNSVVHVSSLSAAFLLDYIQSAQLYGAENRPDRVLVGVSEDSCARVKPELREKYLLSNKTPRQMNQSKPTRFLSHGKFWRSLSSFNSRLHSPRGQLAFLRTYSGNGARSEPLYKTKTGYYDILGVSPAATQAQIKTAYYKQSFIYHPDRNAGSDEATGRFSEISEAYTVLGNKGLRKKYDRGLLSQSDLTATARPTAKSSAAAGSSAKRHSGSGRTVMGPDSRESIYDFDKFFKAHYGEQLQRDREIRSRKEEMLRKRHEGLKDKTLDKGLEIGVGFMILIAVSLLISLKHR